MKHRKIALILSAAILLGLLNGCSFILSRDYLVITPHLESRSEETDSNNLRAENFEELKSGILHLVQEGIEKEVIQLDNYSGDAEADSRDACEQITEGDPLGVYAVKYMSYRCVRIVSYYEVTLTITYQKTPEQIKAIKEVPNVAAFRDLLGSVYSSYGNSLTAMVPWYYEDQYDVKGMLDTKYYENPQKILSPPSYTIKVYPDPSADTAANSETGSSWQKILEINFSYIHTPEQLSSMSDELAKRIKKLLSGKNLSDGNQKLLDIEHLLTDNVKYLPDPDSDTENASSDAKKDDTFTAYGALVGNSANSEGYALAYKALCDQAGVDCKVVRGRFGGIDHYWNIVSTDAGWYHIDPSQDDFTSSEDYFLKNDAQMSTVGYKWTSKDYPVSAGPEIPVTATVEAVQD